MGMRDRWLHQFGHPSGLRGRAVGRLLDRMHRRVYGGALECLDLASHHDVLEIGFGGGVGLGVLGECLREGTGTLTGIDISHEMVRHNTKRFASDVQSGKLHLSIADVADLPFPDDHFDRAVAVNTVYYWPVPAKGLAEVGRVLKPEALFLIAVGERKNGKSMRLSIPGHTAYSEADLTALFDEAGYDDIASCRVPTRPGWNGLFVYGRNPKR